MRHDNSMVRVSLAPFSAFWGAKIQRHLRMPDQLLVQDR